MNYIEKLEKWFKEKININNLEKSEKNIFKQ